MQHDFGRTGGGERARGQSRDWFEKTAACWADVVYDQQLILDGFRIRFALDFKDLRDYLCPWTTSHPRGEPPLIESILAVAWLTHAIERKTKLLRPVLLPEYLEEYVAQVAHTHVNGMWQEWETMQREAARIERDYEFARQFDAVSTDTRDSWLREHQDDLGTFLGREFDTLVRLALSSRYLHSRGAGVPDWWSVVEKFEDPVVFEPLWSGVGHDDQYQGLHEPFHKFALELFNRISPSDPFIQVEDLERNARRDAEALQRVIRLNASSRTHDQKELTYFLTSSERFWRLYQQNESIHKECQISWPDSVNRSPTHVLRHPFCITLHLAHWPSGCPTDDEAARRELLKVLTERYPGGQVRTTLVQQSRTASPPTSERRDAEKAASYDQALRMFEAWSNLAVSLQQNELLPLPLGRDMAREALALVQYVRETNFPAFREIVEAKRDEQYEGMLRVILELIEHSFARTVDTSFLARSIGHVSAFPYLLKFQDRRALQEIDRLRAARQVWTSSGKSQIERVLSEVRLALMNLVKLLSPSTRPPLDSADAFVLAGALLLVFEEYDAARHFMRATFGPVGSAAKEWDYLRVLVDYRRLMASKATTSGDYRDALRRISGDMSEADPRIRNQELVLRVRELATRAEGGARKDAEALFSQFEQLVTATRGPFAVIRERLDRSTHVQDRLSYRVWNNYVYALLELQQKMNIAEWALKAQRLAVDHLELKTSDYPTEVKHTIAMAHFRYAMTLPQGTDARKEGLRESRRRMCAVMEELENLEIPGEGPFETFARDRDTVDRACEQEEIGGN